MMSQPQSSLVVAFLQLSAWTRSATAHPACTGVTPSASLCPHPQICLLGLLVPQPSDTSIRALGLLLIPVPSILAHLCGLPHLHSASCFLLVQQLQISSGLCKPATFSATHWPAVMPDPTRSNSGNLGRRGSTPSLSFVGYSPSALGCHVHSLISHGYPLIIV